MKIQAIFLDLDGTLLTWDKRLSEANREALCRAAEAGVYIIPSTGRLYSGLPDFIRELPFVKYALTINGAQVWDAANARSLRKEEIPVSEALEIFRLIDNFDCIYDVYAEGWGYMAREMYDRAEKYVIEPAFLKLVRELRTPVDDLGSCIAENFASVQKIQLFFHDREENNRASAILKRELGNYCVSTSVRQNIEINSLHANKGEAMRFLCGYLGIPVENAVAFGDGSNDITMLRYAGVGVAMKNASPEVKAAADCVTDTNDEDGVAKWIAHNL